MRSRFVNVIPVLVSAVVLSSAAMAETGPSLGQQQESVGTATGRFDPRDLSGIWDRKEGDMGLSPDVPPMTPEGQARLDANLPARGTRLGEEPREGEHPGRARAVVPALSNDPMMQCNPQGFPRLFFQPLPVEFVHLDNRLMQFYQRERQLREIWLDGRAVPSGENLNNLGPAWYGHSVGEWQGDTLVVQTVGLDDRAWLDYWGYPKSFQARVEERYRRVDADTMEVHLTLYDPTYYAAPWVSDTKVFRREPPGNHTFYGWYGLFSGITEEICAPLNEVDDFNRRVRDPAGVGR